MQEDGTNGTNANPQKHTVPFWVVTCLGMTAGTLPILDAMGVVARCMHARLVVRVPLESVQRLPLRVHVHSAGDTQPHALRASNACAGVPASSLLGRGTAGSVHRQSVKAVAAVHPSSLECVLSSLLNILPR